MKHQTILAVCLLLSACAVAPAGGTLKPSNVVRGVDSGARQIIDDYYSVEPDCSNLGYPEITTIKMPSHGNVSVANGETFPSFAKDNVRYDCNKKKVASAQVFYQSNAGFHGKDFFTIQVRFVNSNLRLITYEVDVL